MGTYSLFLYFLESIINDLEQAKTKKATRPDKLSISILQTRFWAALSAAF